MGLRDIRIVDEKSHLESASPERHARADVAHADDAERFAGELGADKSEIIAPAIIFYRAVGRMCMAHQRDHLAEGQLGDRHGVAARLIGHPNFEFPRRLQVDSRRIDADAGAGDDFQTPAALFHMFAGDLAFTADHRVDPRRFDIPALRLDPWVDHHQVNPLAQPLQNLRLKLLDQHTSE